jgi:hypothetical protein
MIAPALRIGIWPPMRIEEDYLYARTAGRPHFNGPSLKRCRSRPAPSRPFGAIITTSARTAQAKGQLSNARPARHAIERIKRDALLEAAVTPPYMRAMEKKYVVVQSSKDEGELMEVNDPTLISAFDSFRPSGGWILHDNYWLAYGEARLKGLRIMKAC